MLSSDIDLIKFNCGLGLKDWMLFCTTYPSHNLFVHIIIQTYCGFYVYPSYFTFCRKNCKKEVMELKER